ncbi:VOC family protein [Actinokineospora auranticolor]|uniref:Glyoxalase-like protein n=1 Tax=Actinokineospora auranticolor TaxID=155976 RepID=A0A2S6GD90_9PSEU|nr:VOC family protein [Actinokineospora auranticolor]PPK63172.1 glyoxalase-like protein [Actinokineospora auranticolor]
MPRPSHLLCRVEDLPRAVADYRALGFTVEWGSSPGTAGNALIRFPAGPFLELLTVPIPAATPPPDAPGIYGRLGSWACGRGWIDFAVETDDDHLDDTLSRLHAAGIPCTAPAAHHRVRADGVALSWWIAAPVDRALPFVMSAYRPAQPAPVGGGAHANGAVGVGKVVIGARDPERARPRWARVLGDEPMVEVVAADSDGIVRVELTGRWRPLDRALLHGANLTIGGHPPP